jgi:cytochrome c5
MSQSDDLTFVKKFSSIILGLVGITALIIVLAVSMRRPPDPADNPSQVTLTEERVAPVAGVHAGVQGQAAVAAVAAATQATATQAATADSTASPADGKQIYESVCSACHTAGVASAPQPGSDAFKQRMDAKGMDGLVASAINGLNVMPPRGGRTDLSDEDIRAAVAFMAEQPATP